MEVTNMFKITTNINIPNYDEKRYIFVNLVPVGTTEYDVAEVAYEYGMQVESDNPLFEVFFVLFKPYTSNEFYSIHLLSESGSAKLIGFESKAGKTLREIIEAEVEGQGEIKEFIQYILKKYDHDVMKENL